MASYYEEIVSYIGISDVETIEDLVADLGSRDVAKRELARRRLVAVGRAATPALIEALGSPQERMRWEASYVLRKIQDPAAAPALVEALRDKEPSIRWLAATALIAIGRRALVPVLRGLEKHGKSRWMRGGVHHVLAGLVREGLADEAIPVLEALENLVPAVEAPVAAYHVLREMGETV